MTSIEEEIKKQTDFVEALNYQFERAVDQFVEADTQLIRIKERMATEKQHLSNLIAYVNKGN